MTQPDRIAKGLYWDRAWSLVEGCSPASEGCRHCWSAVATHMRAAQTSPAIRERYGGLTAKGPDGPRFVGKVCMMEADLARPLRVRKATTWCVWNDLFHPAVPDEFRDRAFAVMALCPQHTFLILTKRAERLPVYMDTTTDNREEAIGEAALKLSGGAHSGLLELPLPNVWLGVTAENQGAADERIPLLLQTPAAVRFVSLEPLLGPWDGLGTCPQCGREQGMIFPVVADGHVESLDWVIVGGETGPGARPMKPEWARSIRDQCKAAGVPFFFKQMAKRAPIPDDLLIREFPRCASEDR